MRKTWDTVSHDWESTDIEERRTQKSRRMARLQNIISVLVCHIIFCSRRKWQLSDSAGEEAAP